MITARVSAGSSSIISDIENLAVSIQPISNAGWKGYSYQSTAGSKYWRVWASLWDESGQEYATIYSDGCAAPDANYEYITVAMPTLTGHSLTYTALNGPSSMAQSSKGSRGGGGGGATVPLFHARLGPKADITNDFMAMVNGLCSGTQSQLVAPASVNLYYYTASTGEQEWQIWAIIPTSLNSNTNNSIYMVSMDGVNAPGTGSDRKAFALPQTGINTWNTNNTSEQFVKIAVPMRFFVGLLR